MSTLVGEQETRPIESEEELYSYFQRFAKPTSKRRVGMECEFFGIERETGKGLPYLGPRGIEAILCRLAASFHYEPVLEEGHVIALKRGETWITLEPGGQVELSTPPVQTLFEIEKQLESFKTELGTITSYFPGVAWLSVGIHPFSTLEEMPWVPKKRYEIMARYLGSRGRLAHPMMKLTATNQVCLDFPDEETAFSQLRTSLAVSSIVSGLFANSSFSGGEPNDFLTRRLHIWTETDSDRTGLLLDLLKEKSGFRDYVEYLLEMPMIFIVRGEKWIPMEGMTFRNFLNSGKGNYRAGWSDFELHLSAAFPEVRFKQYIEIRGVDAQPFSLIPSVAAFWKGLLYDEAMCRKAWGLVSELGPRERLKLHQEISKNGLRGKLERRLLWEITEELFRLSYEGLNRQTPPNQRSEAVYLDRISETILKPKRTPAETLLEKWESEFLKIPQRLIHYLEI